MMLQSTNGHGGIVASLPRQQGDRMAEPDFSLTQLTDITIDQAVIRLREIERENLALRDNLRKQNAAMKEQYEILSTCRKKEVEKFEQTKALITALRVENQELQVKLMTAEDKSNELSRQVQSAEDARNRLLVQKAFSDQVAINVTKQAEEQGVTGLQEEAAGKVEENIVFVDTAEKEQVIVELEKSVAEKEDTIAQLRKQLLLSETASNKFKDATKQLLKDMESQQKIKADVEKENCTLKNQLMQIEHQRHEEMKNVIATTKREIQEKQFPGPGQLMGATDRLQNLTSAVNMEDMGPFFQVKERQIVTQPSMESDQPGQKSVERDFAEKAQMRDQMEKLKAEIAESKQQLEETRRDAKMRADQQSMEYEQKLMEMARQNNDQERRSIQASGTEDMSILRSQVLTLIKEVDETQGKLSAAMAAIQKKDKRISELEESNQHIQVQYTNQWQEMQALIQNLQEELRNQQRAQMENNNVRLENQKLQASFDKVVNDYKDLVDTFDLYKAHTEEKLRASQATPKQTLEEINRLTAQVIAADEALAQKEETIQTLKRRQSAAPEETSEVMLFKYQAEMYKKDFDEEREARTRLVDEKNKLGEQLKVLREQNEALLQDMEGYNQRQITDIQRRLMNGGTVSQGPPFRVPFGDGQRQMQRWSQDYGVPMMDGASGGPVGGALGGGVGGATGGAVRVGGGSGAYSNPNFGVAPAPPVLGAEETEEPQSFQQFDCPTCNAQFPDLDTLELHVPECLDKHG